MRLDAIQCTLSNLCKVVRRKVIEYKGKLQGNSRLHNGGLYPVDAEDKLFK